MIFFLVWVPLYFPSCETRFISMKTLSEWFLFTWISFHVFGIICCLPISLISGNFIATNTIKVSSKAIAQCCFVQVMPSPQSISFLNVSSWTYPAAKVSQVMLVNGEIVGQSLSFQSFQSWRIRFCCSSQITYVQSLGILPELALQFFSCHK